MKHKLNRKTVIASPRPPSAAIHRRKLKPTTRTVIARSESASDAAISLTQSLEQQEIASLRSQ